MHAYKTIGILGGMGPEATADLFLKILRETKAGKDQDHIPVLIDSNTRIPDRTAAILRGGADPRPEMIASAKRLSAAGAGVYVMPCNTAHYFYDDLLPYVKGSFLHMPRLTAAEAKKTGDRKIALLATSGTIDSGIYHAAFREIAPEIELLIPEGEDQKAVMDLIYEGIKKGVSDYSYDRVNGTVDRLRKKGAERFILGCTELPIAYASGKLEIDPIDPTLVLARAAVLAAGAELRNP